MKRLLPILLAISVLLAPQARAQVAVRVDSSAVRTPAFRATELIAPGVLIASGVGIHCFAHETVDVPVNRWFQEEWRAGRPERTFDNYIQYIPIVMDVGLGVAGVPAENGLVDRLIEGTLACATLGVISWTCKAVIDSPRPNGVDSRSFPSGHTDWVFVGAELVRMEYGWGWGAGAYAIATTVAVMRNYNNWHWMSDCLFGAGLGILTAHAGRWLLEPTKRLLHIPDVTLGIDRPLQVAVCPTVNPWSGTLCAALAVRF